MFVVVTMYFSMTLEAHWNCIFNNVATTLARRNDMVGFDFNATKPMADAATPMTLRK
jgi:hypothetical protein